MRVVLYSHRLLKGELGMVPQNWEIKYLWWPFKKLFNQLRLSWEFLWHRPDVFLRPDSWCHFFCPKNTVAMIHDSAFWPCLVLTLFGKDLFEMDEPADYKSLKDYFNFLGV